MKHCACCSSAIEDFYSEAHGNGWGDAWDCAHDQGHACVTHCTNRERDEEAVA